MKDPEADIVLKLRSSRMYVTRDDLGKACGIDHEDVMKVVDSLRLRGYRIDEVPGEGYRLVTAPDVLDGCEIRAVLRGSIFGREVHAFKTVTSTNDVALVLARQGAPEGTVVVAEEQAKGRGRLGRTWHSSAGLGLWFSLVLKPDMQARASSAISLAGALGVAGALREEFGIKAEIRWPNDVMVGSKKICGVLTEGEFADGRVKFVVLGIGLNVLHRQRDFPPDIRGKATSIGLEAKREIKRLEVLSSVLVAIEAKYVTLLGEGFANLRKELLALSPLVGKLTRLVTGKGEIEGMAVDIDDTGALVLRTESGQLRHIIAGEVVRVI